MGNKLYVTKVPAENFKIILNNTVIAFRLDFSMQYEAAQGNGKATKLLQKEEK
jgi:hypothetical protein